MEFPEDTLELFENDQPIGLEERYKVSIGGVDINAVLCRIFMFNAPIPRLEAVVMAGKDEIFIVLDGWLSLPVQLEEFKTMVPFFYRCLTGPPGQGS